MEIVPCGMQRTRNNRYLNLEPVGMVAVEQSAPSVTSFACCIPTFSRSGFPRDSPTSCADWMVAGNDNPTRSVGSRFFSPPITGPRLPARMPRSQACAEASGRLPGFDRRLPVGRLIWYREPGASSCTAGKKKGLGIIGTEPKGKKRGKSQPPS